MKPFIESVLPLVVWRSRTPLVHQVVGVQWFEGPPAHVNTGLSKCLATVPVSLPKTNHERHLGIIVIRITLLKVLDPDNEKERNMCSKCPRENEAEDQRRKE